MGLSKGGEIGSLLMHASIPITQAFHWFICSYFLFFLFLPYSISISCSGCCILLLFTIIAFYIVYHDKIYHFYPSTTFGSLWASFQDCPLACRLPNYYHYTMLATPHPISKQKWLVLSLTSLFFHHSHLDKG